MSAQHVACHNDTNRRGAGKRSVKRPGGQRLGAANQFNYERAVVVVAAVVAVAVSVRDSGCSGCRMVET